MRRVRRRHLLRATRSSLRNNNNNNMIYDEGVLGFFGGRVRGFDPFDGFAAAPVDGRRNLWIRESAKVEVFQTKNRFHWTGTTNNVTLQTEKKYRKMWLSCAGHGPVRRRNSIKEKRNPEVFRNMRECNNPQKVPNGMEEKRQPRPIIVF